jgi:hypothetical protein
VVVEEFTSGFLGFIPYIYFKVLLVHFEFVGLFSRLGKRRIEASFLIVATDNSLSAVLALQSWVKDIIISLIGLGSSVLDRG